MSNYYDTHELIEVTALCRHATDEFVEWTGDEIIRCKDCKYWQIGELRMTCKRGIITSPMNTGYDFCSYGVAKEATEKEVMRND